MVENPHSKTGDETIQESITSAVVSRIAASTGRDETELPPLYETLDPDALDELFCSSTANMATLSFKYAGQQVTIHSDRTIHLAPQEA
ncbi:HalOD1 output domain-containing protein [Halocatena marina]|uniref:HalOD1 output domain-containing protein n=1 Tax=Halocatena marina TaxID=2934937 RepID=A0ABD5YUM2_9EURY|nr:HalOD1 output domain-containing protein [Halocatena marina]